MEQAKKIGIRYGLILGCFPILVTLLAYLAFPSILGNYWVGSLVIIANIVFLLLSVIYAKRALGGYLSFKEAFTAFMFTWIISAAMGAVFNILLFKVIDPAFAETVKEISIEASVDMMETFGMSDEQMEQAIEQAEAGVEKQYSYAGMLMGFLYSTVFGAILGLITAAVFQKKRPLYEETSDSDE